MLNLNRRSLVWLIPAVMILTLPIWRIPVAAFLAPRGIEDSNITTTAAEVEHDFVMKTVHIVQNQAGKKTAEIKASQAFTSDKPNEFVLGNVDANMFDEQGDVVNIKAKTGLYNTETRHLILSKNVVVTRVSENQKLYSNLLHYYENERVIDSPGETRMVAEKADVKGSSLTYDIVTGQYLIGGRVYCVIGEE